MKIVIDDKIPYIESVFESFGEVVYISGAKTTPDVVKDADAIIIRTRTVCNEQLLSGSSVRFIATATIGFDHIDTAYCDAAGIKWANAPGCNSKSVEQYMASALLALSAKKGFSLKGKTIGLVGVGQVGSKVAHLCKIFGMKVLLNDPPRARKEGSEGFCTLGEIVQKSDIISFHVPLNMQGEDSTFHMVDSLFLNLLKCRPILINTSRGEVFDSDAVKVAYNHGNISGIVIDCWEKEPHIDLELLEMVDLATPHIAGYSKDGKARATSMTVQAVSRFFKLGMDQWMPQWVELPPQTTIELDGRGLSEEEIISKAILATYDICVDDAAFRNNPQQFEKLRNDYPVRREYPVYTLKTSNVQESTKSKLEWLGFKI